MNDKLLEHTCSAPFSITINVLNILIILDRHFKDDVTTLPHTAIISSQNFINIYCPIPKTTLIIKKKNRYVTSSRTARCTFRPSRRAASGRTFTGPAIAVWSRTASARSCRAIWWWRPVSVLQTSIPENIAKKCGVKPISLFVLFAVRSSGQPALRSGGAESGRLCRRQCADQVQHTVVCARLRDGDVVAAGALVQHLSVADRWWVPFL